MDTGGEKDFLGVGPGCGRWNIYEDPGNMYLFTHKHEKGA